MSQKLSENVLKTSLVNGTLKQYLFHQLELKRNDEMVLDNTMVKASGSFYAVTFMFRVRLI